ncbi:MAG: DNA polymerase III subunit gamma/tau [Erysipelotrichaceae bacterium]|nr:DNA polymerase III subunit gamma/tau [Erysipelotrichaceae bacterium]
MAYQALYRKYRPATFEEVVGQKHIVQTLKNAVENNRIGHAYLFCGPRGTGKTSIAKIFARTLNCTSDNHDRPCGRCQNCQDAINGSHPDIIEIDAASNNGVDEVRNLIERVKYAPMEGAYKVYIIDEVHMMTQSAFNALLKTIEEPPAHVIFVFATTEPNKVIPTIVSRCQRFDFTKVSKKDIIHRLEAVCQQEQIDIDPEALSLIATLSDGGMRDALSILDQCVAYCTSGIHAKDVREIYGVVTLNDIGKLYHSIYTRDISGMSEQLQSISDQGMDLKRLTSDMISLLKDSIIYDYEPDTSLLSENTKEIIRDFLSDSPSYFRMNLLNGLMETYNQYPYASSVLDYLETGILRSISQSYDKKPSDKNMNTENQMEKKQEYSSESSMKGTENPSDYSEIIEKKEDVSDKSVETQPETESDVSRETLKQSDFDLSKITLDDEYVLRLFVSANKQERQSDQQKYENRNEILFEENRDREMNLLMNSSIIASGDHFIVVCVHKEVEAKEINEYQETNGFESYLNQVLGKPKRIFSVDTTQQNRVVQLFKERMIEGSLPSPVTVEIRDPEEGKEKEVSKEEKIKEMFPGVEIED